LAEQRTFNPWVQGSSPWGPTHKTPGQRPFPRSRSWVLLVSGPDWLFGVRSLSPLCLPPLEQPRPTLLRQAPPRRSRLGPAHTYQHPAARLNATVRPVGLCLSDQAQRDFSLQTDREGRRGATRPGHAVGNDRSVIAPAVPKVLPGGLHHRPRPGTDRRERPGPGRVWLSRRQPPRHTHTPHPPRPAGTPPPPPAHASTPARVTFGSVTQSSNRPISAALLMA
jgi:hypothetical protein